MERGAGERRGMCEAGMDEMGGQRTGRVERGRYRKREAGEEGREGGREEGERSERRKRVERGTEGRE